jgi:hypothetical protein
MEPLSLPAPTVADLAHRVALPPPGLRIPAVPATELPALAGDPIAQPSAPHATDFVPVIEPSHGTSTVMQAGDERGIATPGGSVAVVVPIAEQLAPPVAPSPPPEQLTVPIDSPQESHSALQTQAPAIPMPTLPGEVAARPSPTAAEPQLAHLVHQPSQAGRPNVASWADQIAVGDAERAPKKMIDRGSFLQSIALTVVMAIVGVVFGASLHVGYDRWQDKSPTTAAPVAPAVDLADLATWPQVDPPAIRFIDTLTTVRSAGNVRTTSAHRDLSTGNRIVGVVETDAAGGATDIEVEVRGEAATLRSEAAAEPTQISLEDADATIGPLVMGDVLTVSDVFPTESLAYVTVLDSVPRGLDVVPLRPSSPSPIAVPPADLPPGGVWQYRVIIDVEAFRIAEPLAFQNWERHLRGAAVPRLEAWVDGTGVVRQLAFEADGIEVMQTLVDGAATSTRLEVDPIAAETPPPAPGAQQDEVGS